MKNKNIFLLFITLAIAVSTYALLGQNSLEAKSKDLIIGHQVPDFTLTDQNNQQVKLSDYDDKVIVLEWINPDCPFVKRHYSQGTMKTLAEKYKAKEIVWLAVNSTHYMKASHNQSWTKQHQLGYPILDDHSGKIGKLFGARTTPHMFILAPGRKLVYQGAIDDDSRGTKKERAHNYVDSALDQFLNERTIAPAKTKPYGCSVKYG